MYDGKTLYYLGEPYTLHIAQGLRQIQRSENIIYMSTFQTDSVGLRSEYLDWLRAVSYTHLDVYKRQGSHHTIPMVSTKLIIGNSLCFRRCVGGGIRQVCPVHEGNIVFVAAKSNDFSVPHACLLYTSRCV